jgi:hypothetical protein
MDSLVCYLTSEVMPMTQTTDDSPDDEHDPRIIRRENRMSWPLLGQDGVQPAQQVSRAPFAIALSEASKDLTFPFFGGRLIRVTRDDYDIAKLILGILPFRFALQTFWHGGSLQLRVCICWIHVARNNMTHCSSDSDRPAVGTRCVLSWHLF